MVRINDIWTESEQYLLKHRDFETLKRLADIHDGWMSVGFKYYDGQYHAIAVVDLAEIYNNIDDELIRHYSIEDVLLFQTLNWEINAIIWRSDYWNDIEDIPKGLYIGGFEDGDD